MTETSDKLEKLPEEPVPSGAMVPTRDEHNYLLMVVRQAHKAGLTPKGETVEQTYLKLGRARELRIPVNSALAQLYVVNGRVATMGRLKLALVRKSGRYGYRFEPVDDPMTEARFTLWPKDDPEQSYTAHWTIAMAKARGIVQNAWLKYPDYMLRWRAVSEAVDLVAPDVCDLPLVEELASDWRMAPGGGVEILQETDDVLPHARVVDAAVMDVLPVVNESGYVLDPAARAAAVRMMKVLDYPAPEVEALLAALESDGDAAALAARLKAEAADQAGFEGEAEGDEGSQQRLIEEGDRA